VEAAVMRVCKLQLERSLDTNTPRTSSWGNTRQGRHASIKETWDGRPWPGRSGDLLLHINTKSCFPIYHRSPLMMVPASKKLRFEVTYEQHYSRTFAAYFFSFLVYSSLLRSPCEWL